MAEPGLDRVLRLLDLADHVSTPKEIRRELPTLRVQATTGSAVRAWEFFELLAGPALRSLVTVTPSTTLYRVQTWETFVKHCTKEEWAEQDPEGLRRLLQGETDPDARLREMLRRDGTIFPRQHSWMVQAAPDFVDRAGAEYPQLLEIRGRPPFVLCVMPVERLLTTGVEVRRPTGADAAFAGQDQWSGSDLPAGSEFLDLDVPGDAVEEVLWRP